MNFGHYTAYCMNPETGKWYDYNDSSVTQHSDNVVTNAAYVLYYKRRDFYPDNQFDYEVITQRPADWSSDNMAVDNGPNFNSGSEPGLNNNTTESKFISSSQDLDHSMEDEDEAFGKDD